ncbi:MAG: ribosomal RNA small subunit methyltransferase A [Clostridia bacterium]|nr:ribosomal RNA small subunit methyltransferase A [Clostridia bacterium]
MSKTHERIRDSQMRYKKGLGQNFLYDENLLRVLVEAAGITEEDDVLEIGPGAGSLTGPLCEKAHRVLALELDERLIPLLTAFTEKYDNLDIRQGDVMSVNLPELTSGLRRPFSVVANIPYYITTPLITLLLSGDLPIRRLALMVQKEVADKVLSAPGEEGWGPLAVRCRYLCEPRLAMEVPASCFTPPPKVDSAFLLLPVREKPAVDVRSEEDFFRVVGAAFALRRKTLVNSLAASLRLERGEASALVENAGLDPMIRGERLSLDDFARLSDAWTRAKEAAR